MSNSLPPPPHDNLPPLTRAQLKALFDALDLPDPEPCTHTMKETTAFLEQNQLPIGKTIAWLHENGAGCDCEVIFNTDAEWGEWAERELLDEEDA